MNFDDIVKEAAKAADQAPPLSSLERAPFEHFRSEFRGAFREARGEAALPAGSTAPESPLQFVVRIASRTLELIDDTLGFSGFDGPLVAVRSVDTDASKSATHIVKDLTGGFEVRLIFGVEGALHVDLFSGTEPFRPFRLGVTTSGGVVIAEETECALSVGSILLPIEVPGHYTLHLSYAGMSHHLTYAVNPE